MLQSKIFIKINCIWNHIGVKLEQAIIEQRGEVSWKIFRFLSTVAFSQELPQDKIGVAQIKTQRQARVGIR